MRIAQVAPPWLAVPPRGYGGVEWVVALLTDGLVERGHEVTLFATGDSETTAKLEFVFERAPGPKLINTAWQVIRAWLTKYLQEGRGYSEAATLNFTAAFYVATDIGCIGARSSSINHGPRSASFSSTPVVESYR